MGVISIWSKRPLNQHQSNGTPTPVQRDSQPRIQIKWREVGGQRQAEVLLLSHSIFGLLICSNKLRISPRQCLSKPLAAKGDAWRNSSTHTQTDLIKVMLFMLFMFRTIVACRLQLRAAC